MPINANEPIVRPASGASRPDDPSVSEPARAGFVRSLFLGEFRGDLAFPPPNSPGSKHSAAEKIVAIVEGFVKTLADDPGRDQESHIFQRVSQGLRDHGMFGAAVPPECVDRAGFAAVCVALLQKRLDLGLNRAQTEREPGPLNRSLALLAADLYALEAATRATAAMLERGDEDPALETAALKLLALDALWRAGGDRVFPDLSEPLARLARLGGLEDGGPGALARFIALEGRRDVDERLRATFDGFKRPATFLRTLRTFAGRRLSRSFNPPVAPVVTPMFRPAAQGLTRRTAGFARAVERFASIHRGAVAERPLDLERIAGAAVALTTSAHVLARIDASVASGTSRPDERAAAELGLRLAAGRFDEAVRSLWKNHDAEIEDAADALLRRARAVDS